MSAPAQEFRALWADGWGEGFRNATEATQLIHDARAGNLNAMVVQVRRRGDAFYNSHFEPRCTDMAAGFDSLADLVSKAHNTNAGQRIEIHAWIVTYHIWNSTNLPAQPDHPLRLHPDWLLKDFSGNTWIGNHYTFDPGHPDVQRHTFNVCMDIITNYNVDGLNFDYIRYSSANEGYNEVTVARFNRLFGRTGLPDPQDAVWKQFRRDQVTALLRKVYLHAIAVKPHVKISCDTITWAPGPASEAAWYSSSGAWNNVLQDWRGWMEEGILDLNIPMAYFDQAGAYTTSWVNWNHFAKDHRYNRHVVIGPGIYLNTAANAIAQMRFARTASPAGNSADGICGYSYRVPNKDGVSRAAFLNALTSPSTYDPVTPPVFASKATVPDMPWKTAPTRGYLKGFVYGNGPTNPLDGATVTLSGPLNKSMTTDGTGFYGAVDLPPGTYTLVVSMNGFPTTSASVSISAGVVTTHDVPLGTSSPRIVQHPQSRTAVLGDTFTFTVEATGALPLTCLWRKNGTVVSAGSSFTYTLTNVQFADAGRYSAVVTNAFGVALSSNATLTVSLPFHHLAVTPGARSAIITWSTPLPATTQVEYYSGTNPIVLTALESQSVTQHSVWLSGLTPDTRYCLQAKSRLGTNEYRSAEMCFTTAGGIVLDNPDAVFVGTWTPGTVATDRFQADYRYAFTSSGASTSTATYAPVIATPGNYDVSVWYAQDTNRSVQAPHTIVFSGGSATIPVNQQTNGGGWYLLASAKPFAAGTNGYVQIANNSGEMGRVIMADGVRFAYSEGQEPPAGATVPAWWAQHFFGTHIDAQADHDGDGYPAWAEFCLGTVPTNAASRLAFKIETQPALRAVFSPCVPDRVYQLERLTNAAIGGWLIVTNFSISQPGNGTAIVPLAGGNSVGLYRLKVDWLR